MERGITIHQLAEYYLKGEITGGVPKPLQKLEYEFKLLKRANPIVEQFWGVNKKFRPVDRNSWLVAKLDAAVPPTKKLNVLIGIDHKTGRYWPEHDDQSSLYAAVGFALYPNIDLLEFEFFYVDQGKVEPYVYTRGQLRHATRRWKEEGERITTTTRFLPTPSLQACRYCNFRSDKMLADGKTRGPCDRWRDAT